MPVEKHGWAEGKTFAFAVGLSDGPRTLHLFGEGTTAKISRLSNEGEYLVVTEPGEGGPGENGENIMCFRLLDVVFYGGHFFLMDKPAGE